MKIVGRRKFERIEFVCTEKELEIKGGHEHCKVFEVIMDKGYAVVDSKPLHQIAAKAWGIRCVQTLDPLAFVHGYRVIIAERPVSRRKK